MTEQTSVPRLTLDTMCVSWLANRSGNDDPAELDAIDSLYDASLLPSPRIELQVTPSQARDNARMKDESARSEREQWLATARLGRSAEAGRLDGGLILDDPLSGVLGDDYDEALDADLHALLDGKSKRAIATGDPNPDPGKIARAFSDLDHLKSHRLSGADAYVTLDRDLLGDKRHDLAALDIVILRPTEAAAVFL